MDRIGVFLSANSDVDAAYVEAADKLGEWLGLQGKTLVYGGVAKGLMEVLGQAVKKNGGHTVGILPEGVFWSNSHSEAVDMEFLCANLADRKQTMVQESEILVALPGGVGTLDEVFSTLSGFNVGEHSKKVVLYNVNHCWDKLLELLEDLKVRRMVRNSWADCLLVANSFEELTRMLG